MWLDRETHRGLQGEDIVAGAMEDYRASAPEPEPAFDIVRDGLAAFRQGVSAVAEPAGDLVSWGLAAFREGIGQAGEAVGRGLAASSESALIGAQAQVDAPAAVTGRVVEAFEQGGAVTGAALGDYAQFEAGREHPPGTQRTAYSTANPELGPRRGFPTREETVAGGAEWDPALETWRGFKEKQPVAGMAAEVLSPFGYPVEAARAVAGAAGAAKGAAGLAGLAFGGVKRVGQAGKAPWELAAAEFDTLFPKAGKLVDGRTVGAKVANVSSIESSIDNPTIAKGIREVPMSAFEDSGPPTFYSATEERRTRALAASIQSSGRVDPLIVAYDAEGPYILEGGHRFDALKLLGAKSFPAKVVFDEGSLYDAAANAVREGRSVAPEVLAEYPDLAAKRPAPPAAVEPGAAPEVPAPPVTPLEQASATARAQGAGGATYRGISSGQFQSFLDSGTLTSDGRKMRPEIGKPGELQTTDNLAQAFAHAGDGVVVEIDRGMTGAKTGLADIRRVKGDELSLDNVRAAYDAKTGEKIWPPPPESAAAPPVEPPRPPTAVGAGGPVPGTAISTRAMLPARIEDAAGPPAIPPEGPPGGGVPPGAGGVPGPEPNANGDATLNRLRQMYSGREAPIERTVGDRLRDVGRIFVRAWTDEGTDLARVQEAGQKAATEAGRSLPAEEMAAYLARVNTDKAAAVKLRDEFAPILQTPGVDQFDLSAYLTLRHNIDTAAAQGNPNRVFPGGISAADSQAGIDAMARNLGPERFALLETTAGRSADFVRSTWDDLREAGVITQQLHDAMVERYPYYIPTKILNYMDQPGERVAAGKSISLDDSGVRKFTFEGTDKAREDPLGSIIGYAHQGERIAVKNEAFNAFIKLRDRLGLQELVPEVTDIKNYNKPPDMVYLHGFTDGVKRTFVVPKEVEGAIGRVTRLPRFGWLELPMTLFKMGATARNPAFLTSNALLDAAVYTLRASIREGGPQHAPRVLAELIGGYQDAFRGLSKGTYQGTTNELMRQGGGMFGLYQSGSKAHMETIKELARRDAFEVKNKSDAFRMMRDIATLKPVEAVGERVEMAPRVAQYRLALKRGKTPLDAMIEARTVTIDFEQGGYISKFLNQMIPFFNVGVQAGAQTVRAYRENPRAALATGASMLAVPTVMAEAWNNADPRRKADYEDVPDYVKNQGIVFMLPGEASVDEQGNRRPPCFLIRTREFTPVVAITRQALRAALGDSTQTWQEFLWGTMTSVSPVQGGGIGEMAANLAPIGLGTAGQLYFNRDPFTGSMISTKRRDESASAASKTIAAGLGAASRATGIGGDPAPSQVEFGIRDVATGVGGMALAGSNMVAGQQPRARASEIPVAGGVLGRFIRSDIGGQLEKARDAVLSPQAKRLLEENGVDLSLGPSGNSLRGIPLTVQEQTELQTRINAGVEGDIRELLAWPEWQAMPESLRKKAVLQVVQGVRDAAAAEILGRMTQEEITRRATRGTAGQ